jgi:hypothetical protein
VWIHVKPSQKLQSQEALLLLIRKTGTKPLEFIDTWIKI